MRQTGGHPQSAPFHSGNYRRHFEGWSEYRETGEDGKSRIRRVYTGVYHKAALPDGRIKLLRASYALLWLAAAALFLVAATRSTPGNAAIYIAALQAASIAGLAWLFWALYNILTSGLRMTLGEFRYVKMVRSASRFCALCITVCALLTLAHKLAAPEAPAVEWLSAALFLISGACCGAIHMLESNVTYDSFLSDQEAPRESNQIAP